MARLQPTLSAARIYSPRGVSSWVEGGRIPHCPHYNWGGFLGRCKWSTVELIISRRNSDEVRILARGRSREKGLKLKYRDMIKKGPHKII